MANKFVNNYSSTLASTVSPSATVLPLTAGGGAALAAAGLGSPGVTIILTLISASNPNVFEIVLATGLSGDNVTATRAQEGTTALTWNAADLVNCQITAGGLANFNSGAYVISFNTRQGAVIPISADYAAFYPELSANNVYNGTQTFDGNVTVGVGATLTSDNLVDHASTSAGIQFKWGRGSVVAETVSGGFQVDGNLTVTGTGNFNTSSLEFKENVRPLVVEPWKFLALEPIAYRHKKTREETVGVSAEQLFEICPELVQLRDGKPYAVNYQGLIPYLLAIVQDQQRRLDEFEVRLCNIDDPVRH